MTQIVQKSAETGEQESMIEVADDFDQDGQVQVGISMDDSDSYDAYVYLNREDTHKLVDHLMEVLNK